MGLFDKPHRSPSDSDVVTMKFHQYYIVGRRSPTETDASPAIYRMKIWSTDAVRAKSKFWYFLAKLKKIKRSNGQLISCTELYEAKPTATANYGIWIRYQNRTGFANMYKEYRDVTINGAVDQMYTEMAGRHRVRKHCLHIIKTAIVPAKMVKRTATQQMINPKISFPITHKVVRPASKSL